MGTGKRYNLPALRKAAKITYAAFREIPNYFRIGITERQLARQMGKLLKKSGAEQRSFPTIVAFGEQAAEPHHKPNKRQLRYGDIIKVDAGAVYNKMRGDVTRTWFYGQPTKKFIKRYSAVYLAQQKAFRNIKAGNFGTSIDAVARNYLKQQNLAKLFIHGLGHGVGRAIHQPPFLTPKAKGKRLLKCGEVVTNEPGIYETNWGGIRIEDMVEITPAGPRWLGQAPRQLKQIVITRRAC